MKKIALLFTVLWLIPAFARAFERELPISPMQSFSGLSRDVILGKRLKAVQNSIFVGLDYLPSPSVFQIEDNLPWISAHQVTCYGKGTDGLSRESFGILNPPVLYYAVMPSYNFSQTTGCSEVDYLLPYKITYDDVLNQISVYIDYTSFYQKNGSYVRIYLSDTNARDLGYHYVYADNVKNIRFAETKNISNTITPTRGFYHRGGSCGAKSGCNNYSPRQYELEFYLTNLPAEIRMKLWQAEPADFKQKEDISYRLIFD